MLLILAFSLSVEAWAQYDKDVFSFRGRNALADGKLSEALQNFNILARLDTTDHLTFFFRGITKYNLGDVRGAKEDFNTAVRLNPVFTSGYHYRAITESRFGDYDAALSDLEKAISLRPGFSGLYFTRGITYFLSQKFDLSVKDFDYYIRKEPKDPSAYLNRGAAYLFLGDTLKAVNDYNKAIKLDRFEPEGFVRRGRLEALRGNSEDALKDFTHAIELDSTSTFAYFNRAILYFEKERLSDAKADFDRVLEHEPGNALTLYNRALVLAQAGDYPSALEDMDRVIDINPGNVLAYYNRAGFFVSMGRYDDALADYNKAIELYPDFAKAYLNRSWVELQLGMRRASREDYKTAQKKVREYQESGNALADTTGRFSSLLALDADFAKKDFDDEHLQYRDVDINLKPMFRFALAAERNDGNYALQRRYENPLLDRFMSSLPLPVVITDDKDTEALPQDETDQVLYGSGEFQERAFLLALKELGDKQFSGAMARYDEAVDAPVDDRYEQLYKAFYYMNRGVLRAEMIDFIASIESNVRTLSMDDKGSTKARVRERITGSYDYSEAIEDLEKAASILGSIPYIHFDLANIYCLSARYVEAISSYDRAISLYPWMGEAYFNRGLVLIYLKDKEKGCIDLSRAGELGIADSYRVISKYCDAQSLQEK
ncbi:MAG: tetratricopeptide repeat protein [Bacteroidales bacterium]|nr:tetratricopeptide repeat protein [Bacteroidales bacterium]